MGDFEKKWGSDITFTTLQLSIIVCQYKVHAHACNTFFSEWTRCTEAEWTEKKYVDDLILRLFKGQ